MSNTKKRAVATQIKEILSCTSHRPWQVPKKSWVYYQEWNRLIFLHFEVSFEELCKYIPQQIELDHFEGKYYISLVPFTMEKIRPRGLPHIRFISNFEELNVRTYVKVNGKPGVYFLNIEAGNSLSAFVSRTLSGLPYEKSTMKREAEKYYSHNDKKAFFFRAAYQIGEAVTHKTLLQTWLTERYCLYVYANKNLYRYEIHHKEWELKTVKFEHLKFDYRIGNIRLTENNFCFPNYSDGITVLSWSKQKIIIL